MTGYIQRVILKKILTLISISSLTFMLFLSIVFAQPWPTDEAVNYRFTVEEIYAADDCDDCCEIFGTTECDFSVWVRFGSHQLGGELFKSGTIDDDNWIVPSDWTWESKEFYSIWEQGLLALTIWDIDSPAVDPEIWDRLFLTMNPRNNEFTSSNEMWLFEDGLLQGDLTTVGEIGKTYYCPHEGKPGSYYKFKVEITTVEPCNGIDDDGDGLIDEDIGSCLGKILFVPFCWAKSEVYTFKEKVNEQLEVFYEELDLDGCKDSFSHVYLDPKEVNAKCPPSSCQGARDYVMEAVDAAGINKGDFNIIVGMTNVDICGTKGGQYFGRGFFWAETTSPACFSHEFGHTYDLDEEYTSKEADPKGCNNDHFDINFLDPALGCDPKGSCCGGCTGVPECTPCCAGNMNRNNGRCFMSSNTSSPYGYCEHCYNHITNPVDKRTGENEGGYLALKCGQKNPIGPQNIGEMTFMLTEDGRLNEFSIKTYKGRPSFGSSYSDGPYRIEIMKLGSLIFATDFEHVKTFCEGSGCHQDEQPYSMYWKAIIPSGVTASDLLTVSLFKDGVPTSRTTVNGQAPVADAGQNQIVECTGSGQATVALDASASYDPDGDILQYAWSAPEITFTDPTGKTTTAVFPLGTTTVTLTVKDGSMEATDTVTVVVQDTTPPVLTVPADVTLFTCASPNIGTATAEDACGGTAVTITNDAPVTFSLGETTVTWTATDAEGNAITATQKVLAILGDDPSCCPAGTNIIVGTAGDDDLIGTFGNDCILGLDGDDTLNGKKGNDFLSGGAGLDTLIGGDGTDYLASGLERDNLNAGKGEDNCVVDPTDNVVHCEELIYYP